MLNLLMKTHDFGLRRKLGRKELRFEARLGIVFPNPAERPSVKQFSMF
jgi:hypothetical protein